MDCFVYVLGSRVNNRPLTYVGWTNDIARRLTQHNTGKGARTTRGRAWVAAAFGMVSDPAASHEPRMAPQARPQTAQAAGAHDQK